MGYRELIDALRKEGEEKVSAILRETEEEIEGIREETSRKIGQIRETREKALSGLLTEQTKDILLGAGKEAKAVSLVSEKALSDRLYDIAVRSLPLLRNESYADVFEALAQELPGHEWQVIRINPADMEAARKHFPDAEIVADSSIVGGLEVMERDGTVRIINTFGKRLENAWQEILPELMRDVYERCRTNGTSQTV